MTGAEGPRNKPEALALVANWLAGKVERLSPYDLAESEMMTPSQVTRVRDAQAEVARRLRAMGTKKAGTENPV